MYFKQIEMLGFKSFADKTQVNLEPGITAIVGPNGCGKSNILDALRWSLGEQSAKALRGSHMQDVIFNGSEQRPPMGMAEVTLVFDNADSRLPLDFAEVQVTRRVYRSGESEYLINKAPCRLRDVQEVFMDTGIGTNAYSLIGQGKIDLVLSSKPEDRRYLFEEAAGIIKYKSRKRVAMRKLDAAEQNLLRLSDIIAEVKRQMRSLKRQVTAAIRHRELTETLRVLEIRNAWLHYNELTGQIEDFRERFNRAREVFEKSSAETTTHEARLEELNLKRIVLERALMERRDGEHEIDTEMERLESRIALLRKEIEFCRDRQEEALKEHEALKERAESIRSDQGRTGEHTTAIQEEILAAQKALDEKQREYATLAETVAKADEALEVSRRRSVESMNARNRAETELETVSVSLANIDTQLSGIQDRRKDQGARQEELSAGLRRVQEEQAGYQAKLTETVEKRQAAQQRRGELNTRIQKLNEEWQNLRETKSSQEARLNSLRELRDSYEGFAVGVRAVMKAKQHNMAEADGVIGPVGDLISTEKEYERAMEAALGGNINNVVVSRAESAKAAIRFLKQNNAGRVTFLPLDTIRPGSRDDADALRNHAGVIGRAINHAQFDAQIAPAVEYLLFNTVIVETIDDAVRIARSERRFPRLVTLDGEVVSTAGAITGGRTKHQSRGLLGRSAEIDELETKVSAAEKRLGTLTVEAAQLTDTIKTLAGDVASLEAEESALRDRLNETGVTVARLTTELETLTNAGDQLGRSHDALATQREELERRRAAARERLEAMAGDEERFREEIAGLQAAAAQARQDVSKCGDELADVRVRLAGLTQSMEEAERNRLREEHAHREALEEAERRLEQVENLKILQREHEADIADSVERAKALSETREEAHGKVLEVQREQQTIVDEVTRLGEELKRLREENAKAQKEVHQLELDLTHREDRVAYYEERILTEYNLALGALTEEEVGTDEYDEPDREKLIAEHRKSLQRLGTVNLMAIEEYEALEARDQFLESQEADLRKAHGALLSVVDRIDETIRAMFMETFRDVSECFKNYFRRLFNGGQARIYLLDEDDPLESGIEIEARPPGKKPQGISLLSGGEQAMTAIALLFSIFNAKPSPFCVLDEVDAPLDDANIGRFLALVDDFTDRSQFIIITHSKQTMAHADALFGVTQQERGVSQLVSVRLDEVADTDDAA